MKKFLSTYADNEPEEFNEDFIYAKEGDDLLSYIEDICRALEVIEGVNFLESEVNSDESTFNPRGMRDDPWINIERSRLDLVTMRFKLDYRGKEDIIERKIYFPKLVENGFYFILNGNKYYPIYQLIDASTYKTSTSLTLKTLLMPISLRTEKGEIETVDGSGYETTMYSLYLFKNKLNAFRYYFAKWGVPRTLEFFGLREDTGFHIVENEGKNMDHVEGYKWFRINSKIKFAIEEEYFNEYYLSLISMTKELTTTRTTMEHLEDLTYWRKKLGCKFTKNNSAQEEKGKKILVSFERILDTRTQSVLRLPNSETKNMYSIVRWMVKNHDTLSGRDNMHLANKRLRVIEYLLHGLLNKFSDNTYRLLNTKNVTFSKLKEIFNISPGFVLKSVMNNELLRYSNAVNGIDLFSSALRFSKRGPQSMAENGRQIATRYRGIHESYLGKIGLNACSAGDPGMTGTFSPFIETNGFHFTPKGENETITHEDWEVKDYEIPTDEKEEN